MRPMESGQGCAGNGPGNSPEITPAPLPAASPAPQPSTEQAPAAGQGEGSGSPSVSGPPAEACPASEAASEVGAPRASSFAPVHGNAHSVPSNSDAPRTRFMFQGSLAPQTTELGTGKAADIWETPAAYTGPGVSGPESATFIREPEEAVCPDQPLSVEKIAQEDVKVTLNLLEEREQDMNAAAHVGQSLVEQNSVLMEENSKLGAMLGSAREEILHLRHQVSLRDDLLQLYSDSDDDDEEEEEEEQEQQHDHPYEAPRLTPLKEPELLHRCPQLEALQEQLRLLEEENGKLREEASQLDVLEEEEMLILECVEQFAEASQQMAELSEVLVLRMENYDQQQKEVTQLRTQVTSLQQRCQSFGAEAEKLQQQLASEKEIQLQLQDELQDLREKYMECGGMLTEDQEGVKPPRQRAPESAGSDTHCTYSVPPEALPDFQESLPEELRGTVRRIISDPVFIVEMCELYSNEEEQEQEQGCKAEEGSMPAENFMLVEQLVPEEELGATEEVVPAEEGVMEEVELVLEEAEAWEEVELELEEATRRNVATSAREASSLGPLYLDMKHVLQQLASWQDARYRQQLRQKTSQKGECSHGASLQPAGQAADRQADER